ncbi:hypothetical protein ACFQ88_04135 [Paenibacillus sp. NPDC056579]|uniref:hypothetical protein n=1 Tax=Paenibacillus sp. NPDC056579 TaxID=3345871 RepID=UPI00369AAF8D
MPNEQVDRETDGNPQTMYEDTAVHERPGFRVDDETPLRNYGEPGEMEDGVPIE